MERPAAEVSPLEFEKALKDIITGQLELSGREPTEANFLSFKREAQERFITVHRPDGSEGVFLAWDFYMHQAGLLVYARIKKKIRV